MWSLWDALCLSWERVGRLPALPVVAGYFAAAGLVSLTAGPVAYATAIVAALMLIAYCVARSAKGWDIFLLAAVPQALSEIAHDVGLERWWVAVPAAVIALVCVMDEDSEDRETQAARTDCAGRAVPE